MSCVVDKAHDAIARVAHLGSRSHALFTEFNPERILEMAQEAETLAGSKRDPLPLANLLVSIKDLFDEAGITTTAGSRLLLGRPAARQDAEIIARLKQAGAVPFGRTTMSEFAYSGVGLNPHYGTPGSIFDSTRIPGGSTSGGALTVALGIVDAALGTDTGGSVRIPAAVNGLVGFKPSRGSMPMAGVHPLAPSFDTPGPLTRDLSTAIRLFEVLCGQPAPDAFPGPDRVLTLALPRNAFTNALDASVAADFERACEALKQAGHHLLEVDFGFLQEAAHLNRILVAAEAYRIYGEDLEQLETLGDPRVLKRIRYGQTLSEADITQAYADRNGVVQRFDALMAQCDALVAPTLAIEVPTIEETAADFDRINALMLRNTSLLNLADACAISLPQHRPGQPPAALMLGAPKGRDWALLAIAHALTPLMGEPQAV